MKFLIDTNIFIPLEPASLTHIETESASAARFLRLAQESGHQVFVHPESLRDIDNDKVQERRLLRTALFNKYAQLLTPPPIFLVEKELGIVGPQSNDWVDHHLMASVVGDAVDFLVTEDVRISKKSKRLGVSDRVCNIAEAISVIKRLLDRIAVPIHPVQSILSYNLNELDPIFDSLREDYTGFNDWLQKCKRDHRTCWVVENPSDRHYYGVAIVKPETEFRGETGKILKISTFKVSDESHGIGYGELLLKSVLRHAFDNLYDCVYVTAFEKHDFLIRFLEDFGFEPAEQKTPLGEAVLLKRMNCKTDDENAFEPFDFHKRYGPFVLRLKGEPTFIIPIKPEYHRMLFPEMEQQTNLFAGQSAYGNCIRKAYLCNSNIRQLSQGAVVLFYRSEDAKAVVSYGVCEKTLVSKLPSEIARFVGKRTVYTFDEIEAMSSQEVLAILFRHVGHLRRPITLQELMANGSLQGPPISTTQLKEEAISWIHSRIKA